MFVVIDCADKKREPVRVDSESIFQYRAFRPDENKPSNMDTKSIIIFKKKEGQPDLHSSNTVEQLDRILKPIKITE